MQNQCAFMCFGFKLAVNLINTQYCLFITLDQFIDIRCARPIVCEADHERTSSRMNAFAWKPALSAAFQSQSAFCSQTNLAHARRLFPPQQHKLSRPQFFQKVSCAKFSSSVSKSTVFKAGNMAPNIGGDTGSVTRDARKSQTGAREAGISMEHLSIFLHSVFVLQIAQFALTTCHLSQ